MVFAIFAKIANQQPSQLGRFKCEFFNRNNDTNKQK